MKSKDDKSEDGSDQERKHFFVYFNLQKKKINVKTTRKYLSFFRLNL